MNKNNTNKLLLTNKLYDKSQIKKHIKLIQKSLFGLLDKEHNNHDNSVTIFLNLMEGSVYFSSQLYKHINNYRFTRSDEYFIYHKGIDVSSTNGIDHTNIVDVNIKKVEEYIIKCINQSVKQIQPSTKLSLNKIPINLNIVILDELYDSGNTFNLIINRLNYFVQNIFSNKLTDNINITKTNLIPVTLYTKGTSHSIIEEYIIRMKEFSNNSKNKNLKLFFPTITNYINVMDISSEDKELSQLQRDFIEDNITRHELLNKVWLYGFGMDLYDQYRWLHHIHFYIKK